MRGEDGEAKRTASEGGREEERKPEEVKQEVRKAVTGQVPRK